MGLFRKNRGVISILLVIVLVPVLTASSVLVEMIKYRSASQLLDVVNSNAILSSLADYNIALFEKYGLFAMSGDREQDVSFWIKENLKTDKNIFSQIVDPASLTISTTELYSLQNIDVLQRQIMENQKLEGPYSLFEGALGATFGFDDLFKEFGKQLKKALPGLSLFQGFASCLDSTGDAALQGNEFAEKKTEWEEYVTAYTLAYEKYINTINGILEDYRAEYDEGSTDAEVLADKKSVLQNVELEYLNALSDLKIKGNEVIEAADKLLEKCLDVVSTVTETAMEEQFRRTKEELKKNKEDEIESIEENTGLSKTEKATEKAKIESKYKSLENCEEVYKKIPQSTVNGLQGIITEAGDFDSNTCKTVLSENIDRLMEEVKSFDEYAYLLIAKEEEIVDEKGQKELDENGNVKKQTVYYANDNLAFGNFFSSIQELAPGVDDTLQAVWDELTREMESPDDAIIDTLKILYGSAITLISSALFYDPAADVTLNNVSELPSNLMSGSDLSFTTGDEAAVNAILNGMRDSAQMLGYDIDKLYPANRTAVAEYNVSIEEAMNRAMNSLLYIISFITSVIDALRGNFLKWLNVVSQFKTCMETVKSLCNDIEFLMENFQAVFDNAVILLYEGVMLNGYVINHFTSRADISVSDRLEVYEKDDDCFRFAKSEYVVGGSADERENQKAVSLTIYFIRLLLNIVPVILNADVAQMAAAVGPFAILVYLLFIGAETVLDVILIQGTDARLPIIKTQILCSKETLIKLEEKLPGVAAGQKVDADLEKNLDIATNVLSKLVDKIYENSLLKLNYEDYLWLRLCFVSNDDKVKRIADLIFMEMIQEDEDFSLDQQYTCLRVKINADYSTVMPVFTELDAAELESVKYAGY